MRLALAGSALTSLFVALADGEVMLGVGLTLLGLGTGLYHPAGITLLARTRRRARNLGLHGAVGNFGIAAAPAAAAALAVLVDWRAAYFLLAALAGLTFLWSLRLDGAGPVPDPDPVTPAGGDAAPRRQGRTALLLVYGAFVVSGLIYRGSLTFIPAHIEEQVSIALFGWEAAAVAGALSTVALMGGAIGWYGGGLAAERWRRPSLLLLLSPAVVANPAVDVVRDGSGAAAGGVLLCHRQLRDAAVVGEVGRRVLAARPAWGRRTGSRSSFPSGWGRSRPRSRDSSRIAGGRMRSSRCWRLSGWWGRCWRWRSSGYRGGAAWSRRQAANQGAVDRLPCVGTARAR